MHPGRASSVKAHQRVLVQGLDGDRVDLLVPVGLEDPLGVSAVGLAPDHVGVHEARREKHGL
jgi:hypothetical protein